MPNGDSSNILDHPDLNALSELEKREAERALNDPEERGRLLLRTCLALRSEQKAARVYCRDTCRPSITTELDSINRILGGLRRFRSWIIGIGVGIGAVIGAYEVVAAIWGKGP